MPSYVLFAETIAVPALPVMTESWADLDGEVPAIRTDRHDDVASVLAQVR